MYMSGYAVHSIGDSNMQAACYNTKVHNHTFAHIASLQGAQLLIRMLQTRTPSSWGGPANLWHGALSTSASGGAFQWIGPVDGERVATQIVWLLHSQKFCELNMGVLLVFPSVAGESNWASMAQMYQVAIFAE